MVIATADESSAWYVRSIARAAEKAGIVCDLVDLGPDAAAGTIRETLAELSGDPVVHGVILQTPLPGGAALEDLASAIAFEKDVDGASPLSSAGSPPGSRRSPRPRRRPWWRSWTTTRSS
nr:hypothetical protein GCM10020093_065980 [Planobispora longispora]